MDYRKISLVAIVCVFAASLPLLGHSQGSAAAQEGTSTVITDGGIKVEGWKGTVDPREEKAGLSVNGAKLVAEGPSLHVTTGPAVTYWRVSPRATGDYTVKATFTESDYMGRNDHPHPYGIVIAGNDMGTASQSYLYCAAYGNGTFIVRGMGPEPFAMGGRQPTANQAVHKAAAPHKPVAQEIAMSVKGDSVSCAINGTVVATYPRSELVAAGKLKSTDGVYGIRFAHNTEAVVSGLTLQEGSK